jgi:hypothetical protein
MTLRALVLVPIFVFLATFTMPAQTPPAHEKLYVSLETTDNVAVVDLATFKQTKTLKVWIASSRADIAPVARQAVCGVGSGRRRDVDRHGARRSGQDLPRRIRRTEPQNGAITPTGGFSISPHAGIGRYSTRRKRRSSSTSTRSVSGTTP